MRNGTNRYVAGSTIKLAPDVDAVMFVGFVGWCESSVPDAYCMEDAWTHGRFHDEARLCVQNPAFSGSTCNLSSESVAEIPYVSPTIGALSLSTEPFPCLTEATICAFRSNTAMSLSSYAGVEPITFEFSHISGDATTTTTSSAVLTHLNSIPICAGACPYIFRARSRDFFGLYSPYSIHQ